MLPTCRVQDCTKPVQTIGLCGKHYSRSNRAGLKQKEVELLTPAQLLSQFGAWETKNTGNRKTETVVVTPVVLPYTALEASNIALAKRVKELTEQQKEAEKDRSLLVTARDQLVENVAKLVKENKGLSAQVMSLTSDLDRATTPVTPKAVTPTLVHGELMIVQVDMTDASSKLRVILKGDGARDVAHLVGRKIKLSRLSESE